MVVGKNKFKTVLDSRFTAVSSRDTDRKQRIFTHVSRSSPIRESAVSATRTRKLCLIGTRSRQKNTLRKSRIRFDPRASEVRLKEKRKHRLFRSRRLTDEWNIYTTVLNDTESKASAQRAQRFSENVESTLEIQRIRIRNIARRLVVTILPNAVSSLERSRLPFRCLTSPLVVSLFIFRCTRWIMVEAQARLVLPFAKI